MKKIKKFEDKNIELLQNDIVISFLKQPLNKQSYLKAISESTKENIKDLDNKFKQFYFNIRFVSHISSTLHFNSINFDKRQRKLQSRFQTTLNKNSGNEKEENNYFDSIPDENVDISLNTLLSKEDITKQISCPKLYAALLLLVGCSMDSKEETANNDTTIGVNADEIKEDTINNSNTLESNNHDEEKLNTDADLAEEKIKRSPDSEVNEINKLSNYSSQQIEYARVWLQLGPNHEIDELYVKKIPKGTALNPDYEEMNVNYPEDVVQLTGSRLVDGSVT